MKFHSAFPLKKTSYITGLKQLIPVMKFIMEPHSTSYDAIISSLLPINYKNFLLTKL